MAAVMHCESILIGKNPNNRFKENTEEIIIKFIHETLGLRDFPVFFISRSHKVGPPRLDCHPRRILLVKFISYRARGQIYKARKNLPHGVTIREDLTQTTAQLDFQAGGMRRVGELAETWTHAGKVFIKLHDSGREIRFIQLLSKNTRPVLSSTPSLWLPYSLI